MVPPVCSTELVCGVRTKAIEVHPSESQWDVGQNPSFYVLKVLQGPVRCLSGYEYLPPSLISCVAFLEHTRWKLLTSTENTHPAHPQ